MHRWLFAVCFILTLPLKVSGQSVPHVAVFGGYTYNHNKYAGTNAGFGLNGWDTSFEVKPLPFISLVGDLSKQYGSPNGIRENQTTFMVGPQVSVPGIKKVIPFAHAMAGVVHGTNGVSIGPLGIPCTPTSCPSGFSVFTGNAFATAVGGGVDFKLKGPIWFRVAQVDWIHANLNPDHHAQFRFATGIVFRFGK